MTRTIKTLIAALISSLALIPAIGRADNKNPWTDMPTKTFICDSTVRPEYAVVWVNPPQRTITAQFVDENGPIGTYPLDYLSPFTTGNGRPNWMIANSPNILGVPPALPGWQ